MLQLCHKWKTQFLFAALSVFCLLVGATVTPEQFGRSKHEKVKLYSRKKNDYVELFLHAVQISIRKVTFRETAAC